MEKKFVHKITFLLATVRDLTLADYIFASPPSGQSWICQGKPLNITLVQAICFFKSHLHGMDNIYMTQHGRGFLWKSVPLQQNHANIWVT